MLIVDIKKRLGSFYAYFFRDFENFLKSHGISSIISYYEPISNDSTRYTFFTLSLDSGKELYDLLKMFLENNNIDIKEVGVCYE